MFFITSLNYEVRLVRPPQYIVRPPVHVQVHTDTRRKEGGTDTHQRTEIEVLWPLAHLICCISHILELIDTDLPWSHTHQQGLHKRRRCGGYILSETEATDVYTYTFELWEKERQVGGEEGDWWMMGSSLGRGTCTRCDECGMCGGCGECGKCGECGDVWSGVLTCWCPDSIPPHCHH